MFFFCVTGENKIQERLPVLLADQLKGSSRVIPAISRQTGKEDYRGQKILARGVA
jgi:hypothetical protein